jgi:hypothetical protein
MKHDNPFANLGALDQKLYQDTSTEKPEAVGESSRIPESQNSREPEIHNSRFPEEQNSGKPEPQNAGNPVIQNSAKREFYTKGTYRLCDEALDSIGDAKKILRRQYGVKVNMEEVVEAAILAAYGDLVKNKDKSSLVKKYSGNPEFQKS